MSSYEMPEEHGRGICILMNLEVHESTRNYFDTLEKDKAMEELSMLCHGAWTAYLAGILHNEGDDIEDTVETASELAHKILDGFLESPPFEQGFPMSKRKMKLGRALLQALEDKKKGEK